MAHSFIPQSVRDIEACKDISPTDRAILARAFEVFQSTHIQGGKPVMEDPFAIQVQTPLEIKVHRKFAGTFDANAFASATGLKSVTLGIGSRGMRGVFNTGLQFEQRLTKDFEIYSRTRNPENPRYWYKTFIRTFHSRYGNKGIRDIVVLHEGTLNKRRPLVFTGSRAEPVYIGEPSSMGGDVGKTVTDVTVKLDSQFIYLSCKLGGTVKFFNLGISEYVTRDDVLAGEIKNPKGVILMNLFGLDPVYFASVFKCALTGDRNLPMPRVLIQDVTSRIAPIRMPLQKFLLSGIGWGYHLVHAKNISTRDLEDMPMTKSSIDQWLHVQKLIVRYPPLGGAKTIKVEIDTPKFTFVINFRNVHGGVLPLQILCDYLATYKA